ncbi:DNA sulfur modification protein DndE [Geotalea uraniireducens]|uniref:DNA sulfur modification protein DndE n=1 Tax=Geotalea uraniireducens (strain Rf4) TaxID=351605 RepID=A5G4D6_GEOUR|nr:hypothetical protein Gura_2476 [Geotalea uraniireducens Rf4]
MRPPVEHVRVSTKGKEILIKIKRRTGLEHWNEVCRVALCHSLSNPTSPPKLERVSDSTIDIEWKTFAGQYQKEFAAMIMLRSKQHGININDREEIAQYFRSHLERGIVSLQTSKDVSSLFHYSQHFELKDNP